MSGPEDYSLSGLPTGSGSSGGPELPELPVGHVLSGRYRIQAELGRGGFGVVYRARDDRLHRDVAIKVVRGGGSDLTSLEREARVVAGLTHPAIVTLHDFGEEAGLWYTVSELLQGGSLQQRVRDHGPLRDEELIPLARELGRGLAYAHSHGVIHRDLKPGNILFTEDGIPKLADFGLAGQLETEGMGLTAWGAGTPLYAAPEQLRSATAATTGSDLFSLAATLYFAATGDPPHALRFDRVPRQVRRVLEAALETDPARRPGSVQAFLDLLEEVAPAEVVKGLPVAEVIPEPPPRPRPRPPRTPRPRTPSPPPPEARLVQRSSVPSPEASSPTTPPPPPPPPSPSGGGCGGRKVACCLVICGLVGAGAILGLYAYMEGEGTAWGAPPETHFQSRCQAADASADLDSFTEHAEAYAEAYPSSSQAQLLRNSAWQLQEVDRLLGQGLGEQAHQALTQVPHQGLSLGYHLQEQVQALWRQHDQNCQTRYSMQDQAGLYQAAKAFYEAFPSEPRAQQWLQMAGWSPGGGGKGY